MPAKRTSTNRSQVYLQHTEGEWREIENKLKQLGKSGGFHSHLHSEIYKMFALYKECEECVSPAEGEVIKKRHEIPDAVYPMLAQLSKKMRKPISTIIDELMVMPLLLPGRGKVSDA